MPERLKGQAVFGRGVAFGDAATIESVFVSPAPADGEFCL